MSEFILTHLNTPEALSSIEPNNLHAVLEPDRVYLASRGVEIPSPESGRVIG